MQTEYWGPYTTRELQEQVTSVKFLILDKLLRDGKISPEDYQHYSKDFAVIAAKPTLFSKIWKKLMKGADDDYFILVEQHSLKEDFKGDTVKREEKKEEGV
jgi:hypothetical protein